MTANRFELVNTFYVPFEADSDDVTPVIRRAMALLDEPGRSVLHPEADDVDEPLTDHLADIHRVMRSEMRVRTQIVLRRLAELNPGEYDDWSFQDLAEALATKGITARKSDGVMVIRATDITRALAESDEDQADEHG